MRHSFLSGSLEVLKELERLTAIAALASLDGDDFPVEGQYTNQAVRGSASIPRHRAWRKWRVGLLGEVTERVDALVGWAWVSYYRNDREG